MIKVQQFIHLRHHSASRLYQQRDPFPYPWRPIGDKKNLARLGDLEALQAWPQQAETRLRSLERRIHHRDKGGITLALRIHHIHEQHLRFTPCSRRAPTPLGRLGSPFGRSEEHTSELQSRENLVCRLLLEKKKKKKLTLIFFKKKKKKK